MRAILIIKNEKYWQTNLLYCINLELSIKNEPYRNKLIINPGDELRKIRLVKL